MNLFDLTINFEFGIESDPWKLNLDPILNFIKINNEDFYLRYVNPSVIGKKKNKGGNSIVYFLYNAQNEDVNFSIPDKVIKISEKPNRIRNGKVEVLNQRFENEVKALYLCKEKKFQNIISLESSGYVKNSVRYQNLIFPFYIMEFAEYDLKQYLDNNDLEISNKIALCLNIAYGLQELEQIGIYHRDLKPDNIFFVENEWKLGDLGLIDYRNEDFVDESKGIIGPRGWLSPEAMNKYLTNDSTKPHNFDCNIDHQSDIFQLGKVFWYIIQGNAPIGCVKTIDFHEKNTELYTLLRTMLNHSKKKRYKHISEVITILRRINVNILIK